MSKGMMKVSYMNKYPTVIRVVSVMLLSLLATTTAAGDSTYDFIQLHALRSEYVNLDDFTLKGFEVRAGYSIGRFFGEYRYRDLRDKPDARELDEDRRNFSIGYAFPARGKTHFDVRLNRGDVNMIGTSPNGGLKLQVDYYGVSAYAHHQLSERTRLYVGLEQQNWRGGGSTQKAYHLGAAHRVSWFSLGAEYTKYSDTDAMSIFARYSF